MAGSDFTPDAVMTLRRNKLLCTCSRITSACCSGPIALTMPPSAPESAWGRSRSSVTPLK